MSKRVSESSRTSLALRGTHRLGDVDSCVRGQVETPGEPDGGAGVDSDTEGIPTDTRPGPTHFETGEQGRGISRQVPYSVWSPEIFTVTTHGTELELPVALRALP